MSGNLLKWYTPDKLLYLKFVGPQNIKSLDAMSQQVLEILDDSKKRLNILVDLTDLSSGYHTADQLRDTQEYMSHTKLESAYIVSGNKLNRLMTLMAFHACRVPSMKFNSFSIAENYLKARGLIEPHMTIHST